MIPNSIKGKPRNLSKRMPQYHYYMLSIYVSWKGVKKLDNLNNWFLSVQLHESLTFHKLSIVFETFYCSILLHQTKFLNVKINVKQHRTQCKRKCMAESSHCLENIVRISNLTQLIEDSRKGFTHLRLTHWKTRYTFQMKILEFISNVRIMTYFPKFRS